ncbi:carboxypeptidase regulatory-like domain-containing protein [Planctomycetota bacterium]
MSYSHRCLLILGVCSVGLLHYMPAHAKEVLAGSEDPPIVDWSDLFSEVVNDMQGRRRLMTSGQESTLNGLVYDPNGQPLAGVDIAVVSAEHRSIISDSQGCFELSWWDRLRPGLPNDMREFLLVARYPPSNLAVAEVIDSNTTAVDLVLQPDLTCSGQIVDTAGVGIRQAMVRLTLSPTRRVFSLSSQRCDDQGRFEMTALPPGYTYTVEASAQGFGTIRERLATNDLETGTQHIGPLTLPTADLSLSGYVIDERGRPLSDVDLRAFGEGQPSSLRITSDMYGSFSFDRVCPGPIRLFARKPGRPLSADVVTSGGVTGLKIVMQKPSRRRTRQVFQPSNSLVGQLLPDLTRLEIDVTQIELNDKPILLCFWDVEQRAARRCLLQLKEQAPWLKEKGIMVLAVHSSCVEQQILKDWVEKNTIPFATVVMTGNTQDTLSKWGVRAIPWLILTDKEYIVRAEGFAVDEMKKLDVID